MAQSTLAHGPGKDPATTTNPSPSAPAPAPMQTHSNKIDILNTAHGRILCVADARGCLSQFNTLAQQHDAAAIIHTGDLGFYEPGSLSTISERTLRHLVQYSTLISSTFKATLLSPSTSFAQMKHLILHPPPHASSSPSTSTSTSFFPLSEFPSLLTGDLKLSVPVYTVWGACEDVSLIEKLRVASSSLSPNANVGASRLDPAVAHYAIHNLTVLDEATTRVLLIGGLRLRLFGLGGAVVRHKLFDNGMGIATIAGGNGTMWTTMLQIGELVDTAMKVYDPTETRLLITHASPGREALLSQLSLVLKADLTISAGLHFRYGVSYNEFSVFNDLESYRSKLLSAKRSFEEVWEAVRGQVEGVVDETQKILLANALAVANRIPALPSTGGSTGAPAIEETAWKNCWNWNLPDAAFGSLLLDIKDGRVGSEMKSQGFNFAYRQTARPGSTPVPSIGTPNSAPVGAKPAPQPQGPTSSLPVNQAQGQGQQSKFVGNQAPGQAPQSNAPNFGSGNGAGSFGPPTGPAQQQHQQRSFSYSNQQNQNQNNNFNNRGTANNHNNNNHQNNHQNQNQSSFALGSSPAPGQFPHHPLQHQQRHDRNVSNGSGAPPSNGTGPSSTNASASAPAPLGHQQQMLQHARGASATSTAETTNEVALNGTTNETLPQQQQQKSGPRPHATNANPSFNSNSNSSTARNGWNTAPSSSSPKPSSPSPATTAPPSGPAPIPIPARTHTSSPVPTRQPRPPPTSASSPTSSARTLNSSSAAGSLQNQNQKGPKRSASSDSISVVGSGSGSGTVGASPLGPGKGEEGTTTTTTTTPTTGVAEEEGKEISGVEVVGGVPGAGVGAGMGRGGRGGGRGRGAMRRGRGRGSGSGSGGEGAPVMEGGAGEGEGPGHGQGQGHMGDGGPTLRGRGRGRNNAAGGAGAGAKEGGVGFSAAISAAGAETTNTSTTPASATTSTSTTTTVPATTTASAPSTNTTAGAGAGVTKAGAAGLDRKW